MLAALVAGGCGAAGEPPRATRPATAAARTATAPAADPAPPARPALCAPLRARVTGRVTAPAATELSGLVLSRTQRGVGWTHNDSGDSARLLAVTTGGRLLAELSVSGAENVDWEDIAAARGTLLAADIGDNLAQRPSVSVYRVAEPPVGGGAGSTIALTAPATRMELRYPDGPRDAEALLRDPVSGALVIVEKSYGRHAGVYVAARPRATAGAPLTLRRSGRLELGVGEPVTAGDVSADGSTIALRSYDRVFVWRRRAGESVAAALRRKPCSAGADLLAEGQGEALALNRGGTAFYTVPEGPRPAIRRYAPIG
ncbi:MAG: hypothetical protein QOJ89_3124 [bacterium]